MTTQNPDGTPPAVNKKSTSETGHARNLAAFDLLIKIVERHAERYSPPSIDLNIVSLRKLYSNAKTSLDQCKAAETRFDVTTDKRADLFKTLKPLSMRVVNSLRASNVEQSAKDGAATIIHKIQGKSAKERKNDEAAATISTSQTSYVQMIEHFRSLRTLVMHYGEYAPVEPELQNASLLNFEQQLEINNQNVATAKSDWNGARIERDRIFYTPQSGMIDVALRMKAYMASIFNTTSSEYKEVKKIVFRTI